MCGGWRGEETLRFWQDKRIIIDLRPAAVFFFAMRQRCDDREMPVLLANRQGRHHGATAIFFFAPCQ